MLISFKSIIEKYGKPNGIIHIGAHLMEERDDYINEGINNIIWIEANPSIFSIIQQNDIGPNEKLFNYTISDTDNDIINFYITNNGQSSSILELDKHKIHHPSIFVTETIKTKTKRIDTIISEKNIDINLYNFLNIDIQGAELLAIKGFGNLINNIKYIYTEINTNTLYENCALINDIDDYLNSFEFKRVETEMTDFEWGDALYIKQE
jgi:FkbM family methyltransferase